MRKRERRRATLSLAGAVYGIYKGEELIDTYTTDENGQFTTDYMCAATTGASVKSARPRDICSMRRSTCGRRAGAIHGGNGTPRKNDVNEQVIKGNIAVIKHTDDGETQIETPEEGAVFEVFLNPQAAMGTQRKASVTS